MVELAADVTPEELQVFLHDTDEHLQLLDEDIVKLENERDNPELLQEIFRAAHTIKGSSAVLGYEMMAELTHAMENTLDKLRHGTLTVTTQITDALLAALDHLRVLRENLTNERETEIDVTAVIERLEKLTSSKSKGKSGPQTSGKGDGAAGVPLTEEGRQRLLEALSTGDKAYLVSVDVDEETDWAAVRFFQVITELAEKGPIIASVPTKEDIEAEKVGCQLRIVYASLLEPDELQGLLTAIPDIVKVTVESYDLTRMATVPGESREEPDAVQEVDEIIRKAANVSPEAARGVPKTEAHEAVKVAETVRIDVNRLDSLMNQIGELVVARTALTRIVNILSRRYKDDIDVLTLGKTITNVTKIADDLQLDITEARMMPVGTVFNRFPRMIRDLAQKAGKQVEFIIEGQDTGIDRSVIEHIRDPLVHLLRNAVDHGVETPEKRRAAGKPERAIIRLAAAHDQSHIVISVTDDGKGIDGAIIKKAAVKKGMLTGEQAARMDDSEAIYLIFDAGMSTAEKVTDVSGRGVGMDIVRQNIEAFNGHISVETKVGEGTAFKLRLPLTLATIQGLLITSGGVTYAIPLLSVSETLRMNHSEVHTVTQKEVIRLRDRVVPLLHMGEVLGMSKRQNGSQELLNVVVVKTGERMVGLTVDSFREPQEVVVKSLGGFIGDVKGIAGASILGTGEVALILDVPSLIKSVIMRE